MRDAQRTGLWPVPRCARAKADGNVRREGTAYNDLKSLAASIGIERNAVRVKKEDCFEKWAIPSAMVNTPPVHMVLNRQGNAVDAGAIIPNINDEFAGQGPDMGALEPGKPLPHYGPRPSTSPAR